jgi:hypothetical protein
MPKQKAPHVRTRKIVENSRLAGIGRGLNAHRMVAETAVAMAQSAYEQYMSAHNELYRAFRQDMTDKQARLAFVARVAPALLEEARLALTDCLSQPDDVCSVRLKEEIADALIKDTDLRANRSVAAQHAMISGMVH